RGHQAVLVELKIGENFGDFQTGLVAGGAFAPQILCRVGLLLGLASELAGLLECRAIQRRVHAQHVVEPAVEVDAAVSVDRLKRSDLYHLTLPSAQLLRRTPAF